MKLVTILCEYLAGLVVLLFTLIASIVGGIVGLFELPRYFKARSK